MTRSPVFFNNVIFYYVVTILFIFAIYKTKFHKEAKIFKLESCGCDRWLVNVHHENISFRETSCGQDAYQRGPHQKVVAFSFYGDKSSAEHKLRGYFDGIQNNLLLVLLHYPGWSMRLYHDIAPGDQLMSRLCNIACSNSNIDLCYVNNLPGTPVENASSIFAMNWRFFPSLDPQVDMMVSRDLDSLISGREAAAVEEWLESDKQVHVMRDHPAHGTVMLGGTFIALNDEPSELL